MACFSILYIHQYQPLPVYKESAIRVNTSKSTYTFTSVMFVLFSGYRGSHDSGFSQSVRLSNVSSVHDSSIVGPPVPHRGPPDYFDMTGQAKLEPPTTRTANGQF